MVSLFFASMGKPDKRGERMPSCRNRGKFPGRRGRPKKEDVAAIEEQKVFPMTPAGQLKKMAAVDVRDICPDEIGMFTDISLPASLSLHEFFAELISKSSNPFVFVQDGYMVKLGGYEYLRIGEELPPWSSSYMR